MEYFRHLSLQQNAEPDPFQFVDAHLSEIEDCHSGLFQKIKRFLKINTPDLWL